MLFVIHIKLLAMAVAHIQYTNVSIVYSMYVLYALRMAVERAVEAMWGHANVHQTREARGDDGFFK